MTTPRDLVACEDPARCITCSDAADRMRVVSVDAESAIATCVDGAARRSEVMLALTPGVKPGDDVLVHAGVALSFAPRAGGLP
jgi:hypothetical protein